MVRQFFYLIISLLAVVLMLGNATIASADPTVTLTVLNSPNEFGDVIVVSGDSVEVELTVLDDLNETSDGDLIRLIRISDSVIANEQKRGKELIGSRSLGTQKTNGINILGELEVQYVSAGTGQVIAVSDKSIFLVDNQAIVELTGRTTAVEKETVLVKEETTLVKTKADLVDLKAEETKTKVAVLEPKVEQVELKVIATDTKATEAKTKADLVDLKAEETKTKVAVLEPKVEQVELKVIATDTKATEAKTKADLVDLKAEETKTKVIIMEPKVEETKTKIAILEPKVLAVETKVATKAEKTIVDEKILALDVKKADKVVVDTKAEKVLVDANKLAIEKNAQDIVKKAEKTIVDQKFQAIEEKITKLEKVTKVAQTTDNVLIVALDGSGDFTNPADAITSIIDAAADNTYLVKIMPGIYDVSAAGGLWVKDYVDIEGSGQATTVIVRNTGAVSGHPISAVYYYGVHNAELRNITVEHNGGGNVFGINVDFGVSPSFKNVDVNILGGTFNGGFSINNYGSSPHYSTSGPSNPHLENVNIDVTGTQPTIGTDRTTGLYIKNASIPSLNNVKITVRDGNPTYMSSFTLYDTSGFNGVNVQYSDGIIDYGTGTVNCISCYDANYIPY
jgi:hypothetical protein